MKYFLWTIGAAAASWVIAWVCYNFFAHPTVWYDDLAPKDFNEEDKWWGEE